MAKILWAIALKARLYGETALDAHPEQQLLYEDN